ncbi:MAG TPA: GntR family transcriptional regulator [Crenalkalicoccus sp.]|jgi:GntR family transcriptional regulator|nr:GntR family transcriptional regulator [Crenalkalicoccus sp.]
MDQAATAPEVMRRFGEGAALERSSPLPLHAQLRRLLTGVIAKWPSPALRFPTERELSQHFGISRMTVRHALDELVERGHLRRSRGAGTFVAFRKVEERFTPAMDFLDQWAHHGRAIAFRLLRYGLRPAPAAEAAALGLAPDTSCLVIERLRLAGTVPVSLDLRVVPPALAGHVGRKVAASGSLLDALRQATAVVRATMRIEATGADARVARRLEVAPGDPVLFRELVYRDADGARVMAGHSFYRADQSRTVVDIPIAPSSPRSARERTPDA